MGALALARGVSPVMKSPEHIGHRIAAARRMAGMTQGALARHLTTALRRDTPISQTTISDWENRGRIPEEVLSVIEPLFGTSLMVAEAPGASWSNGAALADAGTTVQEADQGAIEPDVSEFMEIWRCARNLPRNFPNLAPLADDELLPPRQSEAGGNDRPVRQSKLFLNFDHRREIEHLLDRLNDRRGQRILVPMGTGHGVSTVSRFVYLRTRRDARRLAHVPVHISAVEVIDRERSFSSEDFEEQMRRRLLFELCMEDWRPTLDGATYLRFKAELGDARRRLIGEWSRLMREGGHARPLDLIRWEEFADSGALFRCSPKELLRRLSDDYQVHVSIQVDASSTSGGVTATDQLAHHLAFEQLAQTVENWRNGSGQQMRAGFSEVYFAGHDLANDLRRTFTRFRPGEDSFTEITLRPFTPAEVFVILTRHFGESLGEKVDPDLLTDIVSPTIPLSETLRVLDERMRACFRRTRTVPYRLS